MAVAQIRITVRGEQEHLQTRTAAVGGLPSRTGVCVCFFRTGDHGFGVLHRLLVAVLFSESSGPRTVCSSCEIYAS